MHPQTEDIPSGTDHALKMSTALLRIRNAVNDKGWGSRTSRILNTVTPGGRTLLFSHLMQSPNPIEMSHSYDKLAALGYRTADDLPSASSLSLKTILRNRITAERLRVLDECGVRESDLGRSRDDVKWERDGWLLGNLDVLRRAVGADAETEYRILLESVSSRRVARLDACIAADLHEKREIEATDIDPGTISAIRGAIAPKNWALTIARRGHSVETVKRYGAALAHDYTPQQLKASPVDPAVLQELAAAPGRFSLKDLEALAKAGYESRQELDTMARAFGHPNTGELVTARHCIPAETAAAWAHSDANLGRHLDIDDLYDLQTLRESGFPTPEAMAGHRLHWQSQWEVPAKHPLSVYGGIARSGADPTQATAMSRAGIPSYKFFDHVNDADYWASGEPYREKFIQAHQTVADAGWLADQLVWTYTRENYREGI